MHKMTSHGGENRLGLAEVCQRYVNELWFADHMKAEQGAASALDSASEPFRPKMSCGQSSNFDSCWEWAQRFHRCQPHAIRPTKPNAARAIVEGSGTLCT